jgi:formylglycine-generating enzyme required for sulfatase activity
VTYDLDSPDGPATIVLRYTLDGGVTFARQATTVAGDVGPGVEPGTARTILWDAAADQPNIQYIGNFQVMVVADDGAPIGTTVSVDEAAAEGNSPAPEITIRLVFSEPVEGLEPADLLVSGGTVTSITPVSPTEFTASATMTAWGPVTIELPAGAVTSALGTGTPNAPASFAYRRETMTFVHVPAGTFIMGNSGIGFDAIHGREDEFPPHEVTLSAHEIAKYMVTNEQMADLLTWALGQPSLIAANETGAPYTQPGIVYLHPSRGESRALFYITDFESDIRFADGRFQPKSRPSSFGMIDKSDHPAHQTTWYGAVAFCNMLSMREGKPVAYDLSTWELIDADPDAPGLQYVAGYRLPTEAEWERAAVWNGTRRFVYATQEDVLEGKQRANYRDDNPLYVNPFDLLEYPPTAPVGWFNGVNISPNGMVQTIDSPSPVGTYDMTGNLWDWCHDWFDADTYKERGPGPVVDPTGPATGESGRLLKGGSLFWDPTIVRSSLRGDGLADFRFYSVSFRMVISR